MAREGILIVDETDLDEEQTLFCRNYFRNVVSRRVVPLFFAQKSAPSLFAG